jgi:hypothetical protein
MHWTRHRIYTLSNDPNLKPYCTKLHTRATSIHAQSSDPYIEVPEQVSYIQGPSIEPSSVYTNRASYIHGPSSHPYLELYRCNDRSKRRSPFELHRTKLRIYTDQASSLSRVISKYGPSIEVNGGLHSRCIDVSDQAAIPISSYTSEWAKSRVELYRSIGPSRELDIGNELPVS